MKSLFFLFNYILESSVDWFLQKQSEIFCNCINLTPLDHTSLIPFSFSILAISWLIALLALLLRQWDFKMLQYLSAFLSNTFPKTVHDGNKLWTHYPFPLIIWLSKVKYIVNHHQVPWYFFFLFVKGREVYRKVYLKAFQNHRVCHPQLTIEINCWRHLEYLHKNFIYRI